MLSLHGRGPAPFHDGDRRRHRSLLRRPSCAPGCAGSPLLASLGMATGSEHGPPEPACRSTTSASRVCGGRRACGFSQRRKKKRSTGIGVAVAMSLICPNAIWAMDFQFDDRRCPQSQDVERDRRVHREALGSKSIVASMLMVLSMRLIAWSCNTGRRTTCASRTVRSSWCMLCMIGADSTAPVHFSLIRLAVAERLD